MVKILILQHKMIGDVLICSLLCKNLRLWNPNANIDFVANRHTLDVIRNNPYIDKIIVFEDSFANDKLGLLKFLNQFRKKRYDYVIDAYGKLESVLICLFTHARHKIGYKKFYSSIVYNQSIVRKKTLEGKLQLSIKNRLQLLEPIIGDFPKNSEVEIYLTPEEIRSTRVRLDSFLGKGNQAIMVSALGSSENKTYPFEYMAQLMDTAHQTTKLPFILNYRPDQKDQINKLIEHLHPTTQKAVVKSLTPNSLRDYMATAYHCVAVVGNEGGAINIAKGLKKPTFAIFSPLIDPVGWHTEIPNKIMAVNLQMFFPDKINYKDHRKIAKDPAKVLELYKMLKPELYKKQWVDFFKSLISY